MARTEEEEREYRRYLHRLKRRRERRRKVMIARAVVGTAGVLILLLMIGLIRLGVRAVQNTGNHKSNEKQVEMTALPTAESPDYTVPEGFEEYADQLEKMRKKYPQVENILLNLYEYSESMLKLAANNPDALDFVENYPKHKSDIKPSGSVTQEELDSAENGIPRFQQWDSRWGYLTYGNDNIGINGCGPTCLSMVAAGLLKDTSKSPDAVAEFSVENNYCTVASGTAWSLMSSGAKKLGLKSESVVVGRDSIKAALEKKQPVICSMKPGDFTTTGHFIVLTGLTEDGRLMINDPNSITRSEKRWDIDTIVGQVKSAWTYTVP
jgi:hypothetical protein